jgi:hypothetical protein
LEPKVHYEPITIEDQNFYKTTFWVSVFNHGKETAQQCRAFIKLTDISCVINMALQMTIPYSEYFQVKWESVSKDIHSESSLDIIASKSASYAIFQIPFGMAIPIRKSPNVEDYSSREISLLKYGFGEPIVHWNPIVMQYERGYHIELRIDTKIICQSGEFEEHFVIRLPDSKSKLPSAEDVKFTILEEYESSGNGGRRYKK